MVIMSKEHQLEDDRSSSIYWLLLLSIFKDVCLCSKVTLTQSVGVNYKILPSFLCIWIPARKALSHHLMFLHASEFMVAMQNKANRKAIQCPFFLYIPIKVLFLCDLDKMCHSWYCSYFLSWINCSFYYISMDTICTCFVEVTSYCLML